MRTRILIALVAIAAAVPASARAAVTEYPTPTQPTSPDGIVQGPDGALWFTEGAGNKIGRITTGGQFTEYSIASTNPGPEKIALGPDGALWFTEVIGNQIGRITSSGQITEFPIPTAGSRPEGITTGPDGAMWFTESATNKIGRIPITATPQNPQISEYATPTLNSAPVDIVAGPGQTLWFTEETADQIGRVAIGATIASTVISEFPVPTANAAPEAITQGPDGAFWFTEGGAGQIGRIPASATVQSPQITEYPTPEAAPTAITQAAIASTSQGPVAGLWITDGGGSAGPSQIVGFDPATGAFAPYSYAAGPATGIVGGPDHAVWFTDHAHGAIGRVPEPVLGGAFNAQQDVAYHGPVATTYGVPLGASINWGDGSSSLGSVGTGPTGNGATSTIGGNHTYAVPGTYTAIVTAYYCRHLDVLACPETVSATATVTDAPLSATPGDDPQPQVRTHFTATLATFSDADPQGNVAQYTATIDWGDGSHGGADKIVADAGGFDVIGSHYYGRYGIKRVTVTIHDVGGATTSTELDITPQFPLPPKCDPSECPHGGPPHGGTPCPPGYYGVEPNCAPPTPSDCFPPAQVTGQNWLEGTPDIDAANGHILSQPLEFGNLILVAVGDCWHYDGNSTGSGAVPANACKTACPTGSVFGFFHTSGAIMVNGIELTVFSGCKATYRISTKGSIGADPYAGSNCPSLLIRRGSPTLDRSTGFLPVGENGTGTAVTDTGVLEGYVAQVNLHDAPWAVAGNQLASFPATLPEGRGNGVGGFPFAGTITVTIPGKGVAHIDGSVQLPHAFSSDRDGYMGAPSAPVGLDEGFVFTGSGPYARDAAARARAADGPLQLHYSDVWLGGLDIHNVDFSYDTSTRIWSAGGDVQLLGLPLGGGELKWGPDGFIEASASHDSPPLVVGTDVLITHIDFSVAIGPPTKVTGHIDVSAGGGIATLHGGVLVVFANDRYTYSYQPNDIPGVGQLAIPHGPFADTVVGAGGTVSVSVPVVNYQFPLASAYVLYSPGFFEFAGGVSFNFLGGVLTIDGGVAGAIGNLRSGGTGFDLEGYVHACANFDVFSLCGDIDGIVSSVGAQVCFGDQGAEIYWKNGYPQPVFYDCYISGFRPDFSPSADAAAAGRSFTLPPGLPSAEIELVGDGGPPDVTLTDPSGHGVPVYFAPAHPAGAVLGTRLSAQHQTYLGLKLPAGGRWTVTPKPGSPGITQLLVARGLPAASVSASVTGRGYVRTLHYRIRPRTDERIAFVEQGRQTYHVLGVAREGIGTIRFTPAWGPPGVRRIRAVVEVGGLVRQNLTVASYPAPGTPTPGAPPRLRATLRGSALTVRWGPTAYAKTYQVTVRSSDGSIRTVHLGAADRSLTLSGYSGVGISVTVVGYGPAGTEGRLSKLVIPPPHPPAAIMGLMLKRHKSTVAVSWQRAARAVRYLVTLTTGTGRRIQQGSLVVRQTGFTLRKVRPGTILRVTVRGQDGGYKLGPPVSRRLKIR